jgi:hypothetical protein
MSCLCVVTEKHKKQVSLCFNLHVNVKINSECENYMFIAQSVSTLPPTLILIILIFSLGNKWTTYTSEHIIPLFFNKAIKTNFQ